MHKTLLITATTGALLALGAAPAMATEEQPAEVNVLWAMPDGGTPENVTWPQTLADPAALACGVWYQSDWYLAAEAPLFTADGILHYKEDWGSETQAGALRWSFVYGGDCETPLPECPEGEELQPNGEGDGSGYQCGPADPPGECEPNGCVIGEPEFPETPAVTTETATELAATGYELNPIMVIAGVGVLLLGFALVAIGSAGKREETDD